MPRALFTSKNLLGDGLYTYPALELWAQAHADWDIDVLTLNDYVTDIYRRMEIPRLRVVFEPEPPYDFEFNFDVSTAFKISDEKQIHISQSYGEMLDVPVTPKRVRFTPSERTDHKKGLILFSTFSNSCASRKGDPPNKMLSWAHWLPVLAMMRQWGEIGFLGAKDERALLPVDDSEYYTGLPIETLARMMRDAKLVLTIDNGMAHLAATQVAPTIEFYPACLGMHYIVPTGNPNQVVFQVDPCQVSVWDTVSMVQSALRLLVDSKVIQSPKIALGASQ